MPAKSTVLNWTGYIYGALAHSTHIQFDEAFEVKGEASVRRGLARMGLSPEWVKGKRVLDVGTGLYGLGLRRLGAIVEHHNVATNTIDAINRYAAEKGYRDIRALATNLVEDPLPADHFDLVYLSGIFMVFAHPDRALANLARGLKVGGHLYLDVYRSGMWRWFVVDVLRKIADRSMLFDTLGRFTELCAYGDRKSFHLRQVELLIDDLFVDDLHLFTCNDVAADAQHLGLVPTGPATSMNLEDPGAPVDHSLLFAHVFGTVNFQKTSSPSSSAALEQTRRGRDQVLELEGLSGTYADVAHLTAEFVLAHQAGRFTREQTVSHLVNLFRMAQPCFPSDPYFVVGVREREGAVRVEGDGTTLARRHGMWCAYLANALGVPSPLPAPPLESLGYELVRFLS